METNSLQNDKMIILSLICDIERVYLLYKETGVTITQSQLDEIELMISEIIFRKKNYDFLKMEVVYKIGKTLLFDEEFDLKNMEKLKFIFKGKFVHKEVEIKKDMFEVYFGFEELGKSG